MRTHGVFLGCILFASIVPLAACSRSAQPPQTEESQANLNQAQAWQVAETINRGEAQAARLATTKATVPSVRAFATHMLQAHTDAEQSEMNTAKRLNLNPETSDLSDQLDSTARNDTAELTSTPPDQFDRKYIDAQVRGHEQALDVIDHQLMPALLGNEELSADIRALRARVNEHLQEARRVQAELAQAPSSGQ